MLSQRTNFHILLFCFIATLTIVKPSISTKQSGYGCQETCGGNVPIPYPFGLKEGCFHDKEFLITCNTTYHPPKMFLTGSSIEVANFSLQEGELIILNNVAYDCYHSNGSQMDSYSRWLRFLKFKVSNKKNKFTVVGCDTYAFINSFRGTDSYQGECTAECNSSNNVINGSCTGVGCCQTSLPVGVDYFNVTVKSYHNHMRVWDTSPCGFAFVVQENAYTFSLGDLDGLFRVDKRPMVLDFGQLVMRHVTYQKYRIEIFAQKIASVSIQLMVRDTVVTARKDTKEIHIFQVVVKWSLNYLDIDECEDPSLNDCEICTNTPGTYTCSCLKGYRGDGRKDGHGCTRIVHQSLPIKIGIGTLASLTIILVAFTWVYLVLKKRKLISVKEKFFKQNGGIMLQQQLSNQKESSTETIKIYTAEELEKATDYYSESRIIGVGSFGRVYKGILSDCRIIAIKKSKLVDKSRIEQFIKEVIVLSQINHRNVVKLLGCCLETEVPLLVYEFISNGTLYDHIYNRSISSSLTWDLTLKIASETAGVLSYLHSSASVPIIHRDLKSTNILLDDNYTAKVSDFGASKSVLLDETQVCTMGEGTLRYLDPEYIHSSQLTEKSDVYSFGVVLVELITKRIVLSFLHKPVRERNLATNFLSSLEEGRLFQILHPLIVREASSADKLVLISNLAKSCLSVKGEDRPSMKEVVIELEGLKTKTEHPWAGNVNDHEEFDNLMSMSSEAFQIEGTTI